MVQQQRQPVTSVRVSRESLSDQEVIEKFQTNSVQEARQIERAGFKSLEEYQMAKDVNARTMLEYELVQKTGVNSVDEAKRIMEGGFPNLELYVLATSQGFNNYKDFQIKEERKEKLMKIMSKSTRISKDDLMRYLGITNKGVFLEWLADLPEDSPEYLEENTNVFKAPTDNSEINLTKDIDNLLKSFDKAGREKI